MLKIIDLLKNVGTKLGAISVPMNSYFLALLGRCFDYQDSRNTPCFSYGDISVLVSIMRNEDIDPKARLIATKEILDRAHGKPTPYQDITTKPALEHGGGLSKEAVDKIKREILGIYNPA